MDSLKITEVQERLQNFRKLVLTSWRLSVRPPVRMEQLGSHWKDFHKIWYLNVFRNSIKKIQVSLKCDKNNGYFVWGSTYIYDYISLEIPQN
jgi:hypothetical protein